MTSNTHRAGAPCWKRPPPERRANRRHPERSASKAPRLRLERSLVRGDTGSSRLSIAAPIRFESARSIGSGTVSGAPKRKDLAERENRVEQCLANSWYYVF